MNPIKFCKACGGAFGSHRLYDDAVIIDREGGSKVVLNLQEAFEVFTTLCEIVPPPFDRDEVYEQWVRGLECEVAA